MQSIFSRNFSLFLYQSKKLNELAVWSLQSLWHLRRFREELLADSSMQHVHVGNPCVVCALRDIFMGLDTPIHNSSSRDAVAPIALRVALSALYSDSDFFQEVNAISSPIGIVAMCSYYSRLLIFFVH